MLYEVITILGLVVAEAMLISLPGGVLGCGGAWALVATALMAALGWWGTRPPAVVGAGSYNFV